MKYQWCGPENGVTVSSGQLYCAGHCCKDDSWCSCLFFHVFESALFVSTDIPCFREIIKFLYCNLLVIRCVHIDCLKRTDAVWNGQAHRKNWKVFLKTVSKRHFQTWHEENKLSDHMFLYLNYTISPYPRSSSFLQRLTVRSIARRGSFIIIYLKQIIYLK